jgi:hypothetical protein
LLRRAPVGESDDECCNERECGGERGARDHGVA